MKNSLLLLALLLIIGCCPSESQMGGPRAEEQAGIIYRRYIYCPLCDKDSKLFQTGVAGEHKQYFNRHYLCEDGHYTHTVQLRSQSEHYIVESKTIIRK